MRFGVDRIGAWSEPREFAVEKDRAIAYAEATNDPIAAHRDGTYAPPVFAVVPIWPSIMDALSGVVPPEAAPHVVHGEQDMWFHRPLRPGEVVTTRGATMGVHAKASGTAVAAKLETRDSDDALVNEQWVVSFFRTCVADDSAGEQAPAHRVEGEGEPTAVVAQQIDPDQTYRYAEASGDDMPIHLDDDFARNVGLPGIIVHGLCTMAFTSWAVLTSVAGGDPARLARLAVRFSKPVLPGQRITTRIWAVGAGEVGAAYAFSTANPDGDPVVKDGLAEVRPG